MGDGRTSETGLRVVALDYGKARIGVAVADELGLMAHPRPFVAAQPEHRCFRELGKLAEEEGTNIFLLGLPRNMNGTEGPAARSVRKFAERLTESSGIPVEFIDERLSTVGAQARLHEAGRTAKSSKSRVDSASAAVLLQSWLDARRSSEGS